MHYLSTYKEERRRRKKNNKNKKRRRRRYGRVGDGHASDPVSGTVW